MAIRRNKFVNKVLNKFDKMSFFKKNLVLVIACLMLTTISTIGYAALNRTLNISGDIALRAVKDIRISALELKNTENNGSELYNNKYTSDTITVAANIPDTTSSVTYEATITNFGNVDMEIGGIVAHVNNGAVDCIINGITNEQFLEAGSSTKFTITLTKNTSFVTSTEDAVALIELTYQEAQTRVLTFNISGNSIQNGTPSPETPSEIRSVGERTKNLIPTPYFTGTKTINGITFTDNGDGSITVNGTATKGAYFMDYIQLPTLKAGQKYRLSCLNCSYAVDGSNQYQLYISDTSIGFSAYAINSGTTLSFEQETNLSLDFVVYEGVTVNNLILKPQLEEGATTTSYEPYGYKIPITASGKNLFDGVFEYGIINGTTGINGSYNENYIRGKNYIEVKPNTKYKISVDDANINSMFVYEYNENKEYVLTTNKAIALSGFLTTNSDTKYIKFRPSASAGQLTPTSIKVQIEEGTVATSYEPYVEPQTYNIYLDEPLRKIGDYADYIDFENNKVVRYVSEKVFNGSENWNYTSNIIVTGINNYLDNNSLIMGLCSHYKAYPYGSLYSIRNNADTQGFAIAGNVRIVDNVNFGSDVTAFKTWLSGQYNSGTPLYINYVLATRDETETIELPEIIKQPYYTNVSIDTEIQPSEFTYEYVVK